MGLIDEKNRGSKISCNCPLKFLDFSTLCLKLDEEMQKVLSEQNDLSGLIGKAQVLLLPDL
jgi:hypothetical protein